MDPFVRRLIERLFDPAQPLSRNRHFFAFDNAEGRFALRTSKRLRALQKEILECAREGGGVRTFHHESESGLRIELRLQRLRCTRVARLTADELTLLTQLPGVREALLSSSPPSSRARE